MTRQAITRLLPVLAVLAVEPGADDAVLRTDREASNPAKLDDDIRARIRARVAQALGIAPDADLPEILRAVDELRRTVAAEKSELPAPDAVRAAVTEIE